MLVAVLMKMLQVHEQRKSPGGLAILTVAVCAFAGCLRLGALIPEGPSRFNQRRHWASATWRSCEGFGYLIFIYRRRSAPLFGSSS